MKKTLLITRKPGSPLQDGGEPVPITKEEWLKLVESDPELKTLVLGIVAWKPSDVPGHITLFSDKLKYSNGVVKSKSPSKPMIQKMYDIAQNLSAALQDTDGALYMKDPGDPTRLLAVTVRQSSK